MDEVENVMKKYEIAKSSLLSFDEQALSLYVGEWTLERVEAYRQKLMSRSSTINYRVTSSSPLPCLL